MGTDLTWVAEIQLLPAPALVETEPAPLIVVSAPKEEAAAPILPGNNNNTVARNPAAANPVIRRLDFVFPLLVAKSGD